MPRTTCLPTGRYTALAKQYNVPEGRCRVVNNSLVLLCDFGPEKKIASSRYIKPGYLDYLSGRPRQTNEKVASLAGAIKKTDLIRPVIFWIFLPSISIAKYKQH